MVVRCRPGIVASAESGTIPDQRCTISWRTASGTRPLTRREIITLLAGAAAAWPRLALAQQRPTPLLGLLGFTSPQELSAELAAFFGGLKEAGFVEGANVAVEYRWAQGQFDRLPALAADLARAPLGAIAALGTPASAIAAKAATKTIPIVFVSGGDPVQMGLVESFNRPGGNATGIYMLTTALEPKRLEFIHELVPSAPIIGVIVDPNSPDTDLQTKEFPAAARALGCEIRILNAGTDAEIDAAFAAVGAQRIGAVLVASSPSYLPRREKFIALAERYGVPTIYFFRAFADAGGLLSYGTSLIDAYRQAGLYIGRILAGEKPADLPVQQSVKVELVINLKTAKALGLTVPITLLGRADEVIE
jgi:putative ABC transport system substrate-binding protein